ncbi:MAG: hypothetical protein QG635_485, partial [Bacteroidota bacterium]|nr:hypothetical protein [Bacteroidota bacterium]
FNTILSFINMRYPHLQVKQRKDFIFNRITNVIKSDIFVNFEIICEK